ncbi:MAG: thymidine phosphorylase [Pirellulales bacterium]|nr:thymidine phosphorylase [Pirellulales bacterium]
MPPFSPAAVIARKRDGHVLHAHEIRDFISGFTAGTIPDYQMSALAMAILCRGMTTDEIASLTATMLHSGSILQWPADGPPPVDKHSTGGIGDKSSLILAPLLACCDLRVPMLSGRGLGATGGTLDKLESIPGFRTDLSIAEMQTVVNSVGCVITGACAELAPADKKLYALRDVTGTVPSLALITASIMSKKLAENPSALVLDVKWGSGAFMKTLADARALAHSLVATGRRMGVQTTALLTDMSQPNGRMVGNAVEVLEAVEMLQGGGPADLREITLALCVEVLVMTQRATDAPAASQILTGHLSSGRAYEKYCQMVAAQGGDPAARLTVAPAADVLAGESGYITACNAEQLGLAIIELGGGRKVQTDRLDHSTGLEILVRLGDRVERGQPLAKMFAPPDKAAHARELVQTSWTIGPERVAPPELIVERM